MYTKPKKHPKMSLKKKQKTIKQTQPKINPPKKKESSNVYSFF